MRLNQIFILNDVWMNVCFKAIPIISSQHTLVSRHTICI